MACRRRRSFWLVAALVSGWSPAAVSAQNARQVIEITSFVSVDAHSIDLVVRVPLSLLDPGSFRVVNDKIDLSSSHAGTEKLLAELGRAILLSEDGLPLHPSSQQSRLSLPVNRAFDTYRAAAAHVSMPTPADTEIYSGQGFFDAHFGYRIASPASGFALHTKFGADRMAFARLSIRYLAHGEAPRSFVVTGTSQQVALNPTGYQVARGFVVRGAMQVLSAPAQWLFLLALMLPVRRTADVVSSTGAFVAGLSLALIGTSGALAPAGQWFAPFGATLTAAALLAVTVHNGVSVSAAHRPLAAGAFGLAHGFFFSSGLIQEMSFASIHSALAILAFDVGIALAAVSAIAIIIVVLALPLPHLTGRVWIIVPSALIGHSAWHWLDEASSELWQTTWPAIDTRAILLLLRWCAVVVVAIGAAKALSSRFGSSRPDQEQGLAP